MDASVLRTVRHLYFSKYEPSADGAYWLADKGEFDMERTEESCADDVPETYEPPRREEELPEIVKEAFEESTAVNTPIAEGETFDFGEVTMTQLMTLYGMDDALAVKIRELIESGEVSTFEALRGYDFISEEQLQLWSEAFN
jgi:hypothetical protein